MASSTYSSWTLQQNKLFEQALAQYDENTQNRWQKVARVVGKSPEEVKRQYQILEEDVKKIELGHVPYPYRSSTGRNG